MFDFKYFTPTKVIFGKNTESRVAELINEFGGSVVRSGLLKRVTDTLDAAGINYVTLGGAVPNPHLGLVYEGIELCKKENVDFLLAVGGGSAIDSAKAIGYGVANEGDVWDYYDYGMSSSRRYLNDRRNRKRDERFFRYHQGRRSCKAWIQQ